MSLLLHGLVGGLAALSVFGVPSGNGSDTGGFTPWGGRSHTYEASLRNEEVISGSPLGDPVQYGRLTEDVGDPFPEPELPLREPIAAREEAEGVEAPLPPSSRPASAAVRGFRLPPPAKD